MLLDNICIDKTLGLQFVKHYETTPCYKVASSSREWPISFYSCRRRMLLLLFSDSCHVVLSNPTEHKLLATKASLLLRLREAPSNVTIVEATEVMVIVVVVVVVV